MSILEVEGIDTYYGKSHILHGVSLRVEPGQLVALLGRNGAGKTTTLRSIMGLTPPRRGVIRFKGVEINRRKPFRVARAGLGFVPEDRGIFPEQTVHDNLTIAAKPSASQQASAQTSATPEKSRISSWRMVRRSGIGSFAQSSFLAASTASASSISTVLLGGIAPADSRCCGIPRMAAWVMAPSPP